MSPEILEQAPELKSLPLERIVFGNDFKFVDGSNLVLIGNAKFIESPVLMDRIILKLNNETKRRFDMGSKGREFIHQVDEILKKEEWYLNGNVYVPYNSRGLLFPHLARVEGILYQGKLAE